jgi:hypothetical protein
MVAAVVCENVRKKKKKSIKIKEQLPEWLRVYVDDAEDWCHGRMWWPRVLLLLFLAHLAFNDLKNPLSGDIFKGLNLAFHEMGHAIFQPFGEFMTVAGGSLFQCLVPLLSTLMFFRQRDYFGIAFCFGWLATNLFDVATYAADARALALPLVTPFKGGEETIHDWNWMLDRLNIIHLDYQIAFGLRVLGVLSMLLCQGMGFWLVYHMASYRNEASAIDEQSVTQ